MGAGHLHQEQPRLLRHRGGGRTGERGVEREGGHQEDDADLEGDALRQGGQGHGGGGQGEQAHHGAV